MFEIKRNLRAEESYLKIQNVRQIAKLAESASLKQLIEEIDKISESDRNDFVQPFEEDPEYKFILQSNQYQVRIEEEIGVIHKFVRFVIMKHYLLAFLFASFSLSPFLSLSLQAYLFLFSRSFFFCECSCVPLVGVGGTIAHDVSLICVVSIFDVGSTSFDLLFSHVSLT